MLKGKTAVITGASTGIGKSIALNMAQNGANVAIIFISDEKPALDVKKQAESYGIKAEIYKCDVSDFEGSKTVCENIIEDFGSVDILVNNAGIIRDNLIIRMSEEDFDKVIAINLKGAFNMTKHVSSVMIKQRSGAIINMASVAGLGGNAGQINYAASKAGLIGMTKTTAKELAARGVTCNAIAPGAVETDMTRSLTDDVRQRMLEKVPMGRFGEQDEIADTVYFLSQSKYITGEVIRIDGGMMLL